MKICILISTYNGAEFLSQQLDSLFAQSYTSFEIIVRDDCSQNNTLEILEKFDLKPLRSFERLGAKQSFAILLQNAITDSDADYFMFCDQDDVWCSDKIEKTYAKMNLMETEYGDIPILVHTDLEVVDDMLNTIAPSFWQYEHIVPCNNCFSRLLIQNTITGCTVMINRALAKKCLIIPHGAIMHDWWIGLVASQFGKIGFISEPTIKYRQHGNNTIGAKRYNVHPCRLGLSWIISLMVRNQDYLKQMQFNIDQARAFLEIYNGELSENSKRMLSEFIALPDKSWLKRRMVVIWWGLWKQGWLRNVTHLIRL